MKDEELNLNSRELRYLLDGISGLLPFEPGQLITANDLNELVEAIKELDRRLRALEADCVRKD